MGCPGGLGRAKAFIQTGQTRVDWNAINQLPSLMGLSASNKNSELVQGLQRYCERVLDRFERCSLEEFACLRLWDDRNLFLECSEATKLDLVNVL